MTPYLTPQSEYRIDARVISGGHEEKVEQIEAGIQELLDLKLLECAAHQPNVNFLAVPRPRGNGRAMVAVILALMLLLVWLLGSQPGREQTHDALVASIVR